MTRMPAESELLGYTYAGAGEHWCEDLPRLPPHVPRVIYKWESYEFISCDFKRLLRFCFFCFDFAILLEVQAASKKHRQDRRATRQHQRKTKPASSAIQAATSTSKQHLEIAGNEIIGLPLVD